jgi:hypothetical protein
MTTTTKTTAAGTTTRKTTAKTTAKVADIAVLVEAFSAAEGKVAGFQKDMDFIAVQRGTFRVQAARAAAAIFAHPEGKSQYATAAKLVGMARNTFRTYVDAGLSLSAARRKATDVTPADIAKVEAHWQAGATAAATRRKAQPEGKSNTPAPTGEDTADSLGLPVAAPAAPVTFKDVQDGVKALRELVKSYRATGAMTEKEIRGLGVQLATVAKLASTGE